MLHGAHHLPFGLAGEWETTDLSHSFSPSPRRRLPRFQQGKLPHFQQAAGSSQQPLRSQVGSGTAGWKKPSWRSHMWHLESWRMRGFISQLLERFVPPTLEREFIYSPEWHSLQKKYLFL